MHIQHIILQSTTETDEDFSEDDDDAEAWPRQVENAFMVQALDDAYRGLMSLKRQEARML